MRKIIALVFAAVCCAEAWAVTLNDVFSREVELVNGGDANWFLTTLDDGTAALRSGAIGNRQSSSVEITVDVGDISGTICFDYRVSSEADYDFLRFYIDGSQQFQLSGATTWTFSKELLPGVHTLKWSYTKDGAGVSGSDCAWIWDVRIFDNSDMRSGFLRNVFAKQSYDFTTAIVSNQSAKVVRYPEEMYYKSANENFPSYTTYAYQTYMYMEGGVTYYFRGYFTSYTMVKVDDYEVISRNYGNNREARGDICFAESGWHRLELRVASGSYSGYASSSSYISSCGIQYSTAIDGEWKKFMATVDDSQFLLENPTPAATFTLVARRPYNYQLNSNRTATIRNLVKGVTELEIPSTIADYTVTEVGSDAFRDEVGLRRVVLPETITTIYSAAFYGCSSLQAVNIPPATETINAYAFYNCAALREVIFPEGLTTIGNYAFRGCTALTRVEVPDSVTSLGTYAFYGCSSLTYFKFPANITATPNYCLGDCSSLTEVVLPPNLTLLGSYSLSGCSSLRKLTLPVSLWTIGSDALRGCSSLTDLELPERLQIIESSAFYGCTSLRHLKIPETVTKIEDYAFGSCSSLERINIPPNVTTIPTGMLSRCTSLAEIEIPETVTTIGSNAFYGCTRLKTVIIPASVTSMGSGAFNDCTGLQYAEYKGTLPSGCQNTTFNCQVVFPRECGRMWIKLFGINNFHGFFESGVKTVKVVSSKIRENDPTIMDVVYKVESTKPKVKVRALAFEDGERSFAKVVRPSTFIEGTDANIGDEVTPNVEHTLSWRVSADWKTKLAKVKFEVLACEGELLPLEVMTIPASDRYGKMKITWNAISDAQVFDALMWLYASKDEDFTVENGIVRRTSDDYILAYQTTVSTLNGRYSMNIDNTSKKYYYFAPLPNFIFSKMGFETLSGDILNYVNEETRLGLSPSGSRQYGYKLVQ